MNEFGLIKKYLAPLAKDFTGSLGLSDDAALIDVPAGKQLVVTKDAMVAGIHFFGHESPDLIARKLLRVNLSDLAAKGAVPMCYFIAACLPENSEEAWVAAFTNGLEQDQKEFNIHLAGGDTTKTTGPLTLSLTALGLVDKGSMLTRSGAKAGDDVYVSGTLGKAARGYEKLRKEPETTSADFARIKQASCEMQKHFTEAEQHYLLPTPRFALGQQLIGIATACMDISDGLVQDASHICSASGVGMELERSLIPLPDSAQDWQSLISFGDDYELLFTAPKDNAALLAELPVTHIGHVTQGNAVCLLDKGQEIKLARTGWQHF
ncbi:MAG: thiamine-phosphate kinase [Alphaproteobacteria bacterium]